MPKSITKLFPPVFHKLLALVPLLASCIDDSRWYDMNMGRPPEGSNAGVIVVNEGNFMYDNASLSYYDIDSMRVHNHVFYARNNLPLGDVAQSMTLRGGLGYVVLNGSGKIYVVDAGDFGLVGKITGLTSPRHIHFVSDGKAYVTDLYAKAITVVDPRRMEVTGSISVDNHSTAFYQHSTEQMLPYGDLLFVNCWSYDAMLLVVDTRRDAVVDSVAVAKQPVAMALDARGKLWVLCDGGYTGGPYADTCSFLVRVDAASRAVERTWPLPKRNAVGLALNGRADTLYFINGDLFRLPLDAVPDVGDELPAELFRSAGDDHLRAVAVDPFTSEVYLANSRDYVRRGEVLRLAPSGRLLHAFDVGIIPGDFVFRRRE